MDIYRDINLAVHFISRSTKVSRRLIQVLIRIHNKKIIKLSYEVKRAICKCYTIMIPSITCYSRVSHETDGYYLMRVCGVCGEISKMRMGAKKRFYNGGEEETNKEREKGVKVFKT
ncbi:hypothetical protein NEPAR06_1935 [Nematocida parisii]|uniref:Uncharacterized protein n=1 Tax=Nematocida parisii (strain ERTm3) TaxID=935791 RepID=I3EF20_NEMP3|nr:uncharacterized protein NEPG_01995 [Nematocida parisii ERTm1]EIJ87817.1 hypothetical protein NEQG_01889 [Nematocida parisii ERTm3]KAI5129272.1 hypothetical protein NEPAR03_1633 [Nematocida parisii]EIJ93039.1 hypothetical protein NEPG_01995 [Nematocida parisii ERTm1]KAI5129450.1 hypothetical protein NEPAR08_1600 [Nematocida parisii]KAI5142005.1 hypothetical protein NEPAR04_1361 [Nematocida parisii]|eukprot:XP_013059822.1 hypothetical protein NEPG_01995 [Nematocida parisii ERTm1]